MTEFRADAATPDAPSEPPKISVVMSVYNNEDTVAASIDSIRAQTFPGWELVIVDDGSADSTADIIASIAKEDPRIRLIRQENSGLTRALIRGCKESAAPFIARQDSDDFSEPQRFEKQLAALESDEQPGFVSCWAQSFTDGNIVLDTIRRPEGMTAGTRQLMQDQIGPPAHGTVMFRRDLYEAAGGYRAEFYFGQDTDLWIRMAEIRPFLYVPEVLYRFHRGTGGISGGRRSLQKEFGRLTLECKAARAAGQSEALILKEAEQLAQSVRDGRSAAGDPNDRMRASYMLGSQLVCQGNPSGRKFLLQVVRHRPTHWKAWVRLAQSFLPTGSRRPASDRVDSE